MITDLELAGRFCGIQNSAKKRDKEFNLSLKHLRRLLNKKKCYFTGVDIELRGNTIYNKLTIDRIDNSKGYIDSNTVACCQAFNEKKANLTIEEIVILYKSVKRLKLI